MRDVHACGMGCWYMCVVWEGCVRYMDAVSEGDVCMVLWYMECRVCVHACVYGVVAYVSEVV